MKLLTSGLILLSFSSQLSAIVIDHGTFSTDTLSGYDWLDITATAGMSYNDVNNELQAGGKLFGWRYATGFEFNGLISNWLNMQSGISTFGKYHHAEGTTDLIIPIIGDTYNFFTSTQYGRTADEHEGYNAGSGSGTHYSFGLLADIDAHNTNKQHLAMIYDRPETSPYYDYTRTHDSSYSRDISSLDIGSFLVRKSIVVSEPPISMLLGIGMLGLLTLNAIRQKP